MMFSGKVVAITGAAGGIGQALCRYFAAEDASIAAIDKSPKVAAQKIMGAAEKGSKRGHLPHEPFDRPQPRLACGSRRLAFSSGRPAYCCLETSSMTARSSMMPHSNQDDVVGGACPR